MWEKDELEFFVGGEPGSAEVLSGDEVEDDDDEIAEKLFGGDSDD